MRKCRAAQVRAKLAKTGVERYTATKASRIGSAVTNCRKAESVSQCEAASTRNILLPIEYTVLDAVSSIFSTRNNLAMKVKKVLSVFLLKRIFFPGASLYLFRRLTAALCGSRRRARLPQDHPLLGM